MQLTNLQTQLATNKTIDFEIINKTYDNFTVATKGKYYPYNHEQIDKGWGCAWRCIQMIISCYGFEIPFLQLFTKYKNKQKLFQVIKQQIPFSQQIINELKTKKWAPEQVPGNWAEPFISLLVCKDLGIKGTLLLVNSIPKNANAPGSVFSQIYSFSEFWHLLKRNFDDNVGVIMVDDGSFAMCIIGYKETSQDDLHIIVGDPHILSNVDVLDSGIYQIILNKEGEQKSFNIRQQQKKYILYSTFTHINFGKKGWMVYISMVFD